MGVEQHAYGLILGCLPRRRTIIIGCGVVALFFLAQLSYMWRGNAIAQKEDDACVGTKCYEIWSCYGLASTTQNIRGPVLSPIGFVLSVVACYGAIHGSKRPVQTAGQGLMILGLLWFCSGVFDLVYYASCGAYSVGTLNLVPSQVVGKGPFSKLQGLEIFATDLVCQITGEANILTYATLVAFLGAWLTAFFGLEAHFLGEVVERGPLGLGVSYGLGQWDEVLDHDAIRIVNDTLHNNSKFIKDAELPMPVVGAPPQKLDLVNNYGAAFGSGFGQGPTAMPPMQHLGVERLAQQPTYAESGYIRPC